MLHMNYFTTEILHRAMCLERLCMTEVKVVMYSEGGWADPHILFTLHCERFSTLSLISQKIGRWQSNVLYLVTLFYFIFFACSKSFNFCLKNNKKLNKIFNVCVILTSDRKEYPGVYHPDYFHEKWTFFSCCDLMCWGQPSCTTMSPDPQQFQFTLSKWNQKDWLVDIWT